MFSLSDLWIFIKKNSLVISLFFGFLGGIPTLVSLYKFIVRILRKKKNKVIDEFPFNILPIENLADYLFYEKNLTEVKNQFVKRKVKILNKSKDSKLKKILIVGRAGIGKTRYALHIIEDIAKHQRSIVFIPTERPLMDNFSDRSIYKSCSNIESLDCVIVFLDDYNWPLFSVKSIKSDGYKINLVDQFNRSLKKIKKKCGNLFVVLTSRIQDIKQELETNYLPKFPIEFETHILEDLDNIEENKLITGLLNVYKKKMTSDGLKTIIDKNQGYSCESLVEFIKNIRENTITKSHGKDFSKFAEMIWKKRSYLPLKLNNPDVGYFFRVLKLITELKLKPYRGFVFLLLQEKLKYKYRKSFKIFLSSRLTKKIVKIFSGYKYFELKDDLFVYPDYILENFKSASFSKPFNLLYKRRNDLSYNERKNLAKQYALQGMDWLKKDSDKANNFLRRSTKLVPDNRAVWLVYSIGLLQQKKLDKALSSIKISIKLRQDDDFSWGIMGHVYKEMKNWERALECYNHALILNPNNFDILLEKGRILSKRFKYREATKCYKTLFKIKPDDSNLLFEQAMVFEKMKKYEEALTNLNKILKQKPTDFYVLVFKALLLGNLKKYHEAVICYEHAIKIKPNYADAWLGRGLDLFMLGKFKETIENLEEAVKLKSNDNVIWYIKCIAQSILGRDREALESINKALELDPNEISFIDLRNAILQKIEKNQEVKKK